MKRLALACLLVASACASAAPPPGAAAAPSTPPPAPAAPAGIAAKTAGLEKRAGLLALYLDRKAGKVWLEVPPVSAARGEIGRYLYVEGLASGLGSNPVGLDRGQLADSRVVVLRRVGGRLFVEQPNLAFRAESENPAERRAVEESFATSVLWAGPVEAEDPDGRALVDFTSFLVRDSHDVVATMKATGQGTWALDERRSAPDLDACLAFPENVELEALLTYQSAEPGPLVRDTVPYAGAVTLTAHHSLLKLPEPGYRPRRFDPRVGAIPISYLDYAVPLAAPLGVKWAVRHRLEKVDPTAARSPVKEPIVYYVDPGAPEPVRSALVQGASWWKEAFDQAGFVDAFRVELLPEGAHPLDARYDVIQWVHRATRGWSYGGGVLDPRTGEMLNGHVTLGSQRVRQDRLLFEGLLGADATGKGGPNDPVELALARIRQLAAHEVGHSLGLAHNFAASTYGRASVMDYPAPLVKVTPAGELDLSQAYAVGVGPWDVQAIRWLYAETPPGADEAAALDAIVRDGLARGLVYLTDQDARPPGAAEPRAALWDNGADPAAALAESLRVRRIALDRFGERNVAPGRPLAYLEEVLAPVYFHHRYEVEAAAKLVGGLEYGYALRGDGQPASRPVAAAAQRRALAALAGILQPEVLDLPDPVLALLLPRPAESRPNVEMFASATAPAFDALGAAATAADMVVEALLQPERAARLVDFHRRDPALPGLEEVLDALGEQALAPAPASPRRAEIARTVAWVVVRDLVALSAAPAATPGVRARVDAKLADLRRRFTAAPGADEASRAHRAFLAAEIGRHLERERPEAPLPEPPPPPPGSPIGGPGSALPDSLAGCSDGG